MKFFATVLFLLSFEAHGFKCRTVTATSVPPTYSISDPQSLVFSGLDTKVFRNIFVVNNYAATFCFTWEEGDTTNVPASSNNTHEQCLLSGQHFQSDTNILNITPRIYQRSNTGAALTTGWARFCVEKGRN